jgi:hypothetical protein
MVQVGQITMPISMMTCTQPRLDPTTIILGLEKAASTSSHGVHNLFIYLKRL